MDEDAEEDEVGELRPDCLFKSSANISKELGIGAKSLFNTVVKSKKVNSVIVIFLEFSLKMLMANAFYLILLSQVLPEYMLDISQRVAHHMMTALVIFNHWLKNMKKWQDLSVLHAMDNLMKVPNA